MTTPSIDLSLPYLTDEIEGIEGVIRATPEDFVVEEIDLYEPSGIGTHLYVNITKRDQTTREVQLQLAKLFKIRPQNVGTAGLKDKNSLATQTVSVQLSQGMSKQEAVERIQSRMDLTVNWAEFHSNKLRAGHLIGNKFSVTITKIPMATSTAIERIDDIVDIIHEKGLPNYYGEQRTGTTREKVLEGWEVLNGQKRLKDRWLSKLRLSGFQSYLCNRYLAERVNRGLFDTLITGDIAKKHDTGGIFWVSDLETDQSRFISHEISFTAPIFGHKMSTPLGESAALEEKILEDTGVTLETLKRAKLTGTRRFGRQIPKIEVKANQRGIQLSFTLSKGGYATTLLREIMKN